MRIWLVGMMGTGKTAAGRVAANRLGVGFADTDELVEAEAGRSIQDLWESDGESAFRDLEREVVGDLAAFDGVIATGGGVVLDAGNREVIREGTVVWLRAAPPALVERLGRAEDRPLLSETVSSTDGTLSRLLEERGDLYRSLADHEIDTENLEVDEVARRIESLWRG